MSQSVNVSYDPVRVQRVIIEGNDHTADSFIFNKLKSIPESKDVGTLTQNISSSMRELSHTNLFKNIAAYVDSAESGEVGDVDVIIDLKEKTRFTVTFGIFQATDGSSTTGSVTGEMRNIVGHGEGLTLSCNVENEGLSGVNLSSVRASLHSLPLFKDSTSTNSITVFKETHNRAYYSSLTGTSTGVSAGMTSASGVHNVEIESAFRHYSLAAEHSARATPEVLSETFAPTTKNALKYAYRVDTRADGEFTGAHFPTEGALKLVRAELAGLGGDVAFTKVECLAQWLRPVAGSAVTAALTVRGGVVRSWDALARLPATLTGSAGSGDAGAGARGTAVMSGSVNAPVVRAPPVPIADRFFQNNLFVRGFTPREISPQDAKSNALGGDTFVSAGLALSAPFPGYASLAVRPQVFANVGAVASAHPGLSSAGFGSLPGWLGAGALSKAMHASVGAGLALPTPFGRLELNLASPVVAKGGVALGKPGFSIGLAMDW